MLNSSFAEVKPTRTVDELYKEGHFKMLRLYLGCKEKVSDADDQIVEETSTAIEAMVAKEDHPDMADGIAAITDLIPDPPEIDNTKIIEQPPAPEMLPAIDIVDIVQDTGTEASLMEAAEDTAENVVTVHPTLNMDLIFHNLLTPNQVNGGTCSSL